jgi:hypothetical protein
MPGVFDLQKRDRFKDRPFVTRNKETTGCKNRTTVSGLMKMTSGISGWDLPGPRPRQNGSVRSWKRFSVRFTRIWPHDNKRRKPADN